MKSSNFLRKSIQDAQGKRFKTLSELAEKTGINQGNLSSFMKPEGDPKRRENITFDTAWKILHFLGLDFSAETQVPQGTCPQCTELEREVLRLQGEVSALERQLDKHRQPAQPIQEPAGREKEQKYLPLGNGTEG